MLRDAYCLCCRPAAILFASYIYPSVELFFPYIAPKLAMEQVQTMEAYFKSMLSIYNENRQYLKNNKKAYLCYLATSSDKTDKTRRLAKTVWERILRGTFQEVDTVSA